MAAVISTLETPIGPNDVGANGGSVTFSSVTTSSLANRQRMNLVLELSPKLTADTEETIVVQPSHWPTFVTASVSVSSGGARGMRSPAYVSAQRRRRVLKILDLLAALAGQTGRPDFHSFTFPVFHEVRSLIAYLTDFEAFEGNTLAILRQVRNTFLDGGWNNYREAKARDAIASVLKSISSKALVIPSDVRDSFKLLYRSNLGPSAATAIDEVDHSGDALAGDSRDEEGAEQLGRDVGGASSD